MALAPLHYFGLRKGCLSFVLAIIGAVLPALLYPAHGQETAATLTAMQALPESIELTFSAPVEFRSATLRGNAEQAGRFYVDAFPASLTPQRGSTLEIATGPIRRVRSSLFRPGVVRVVLDLREGRNFQVATLTEPYRLVIAAQQKDAATSHAQPVTHPIETRQTSVTSEKDVAEKIVQPHVFPNVAWKVTTQPWTLMLHSRPAAADTAFSPSSLVTPMDAARRTAFDAVELGSLSRVDGFTGQLFIFSPDFSFSHKQSLPLSPVGPTTETAPLPTQEFSVGGEWEGVCQDGGCVRFAASDNEEVDLNPVREQQRETKTIDTEEEQQVASASEQPAQEAIRIGGTVMGELWMAAMTAGVFLSFLSGIGVVVLWNLRKRGTSTEKSDGWEGRMAYLEEAVTRAGMLNNSFFHSLEVSQKRLESLLTQADVTEQNLRRLLHQAAFTGERSPGRAPDALATASLLLSEGEAVQQVARVLKLPMAQVRLLQEIRQYTQGEKPAETPEKATGHSPLAGGASSLNNLTSRLNGAARNGMHFAEENEQSL
ncbi:MAG: hypothetical protein AB7P69_14940 [Candidatus Binatia bacterium]